MARMDVLPSSDAARHIAENLGPVVAVLSPGVTTLSLLLRVESLTGLTA